MSKLNEKYEVIKNNLKCDYIRYPLSETNTINTANSQIRIIIPRETSVFSLLNIYFDLYIEQYYMLLVMADMQIKIIKV